MISWRKDIIMSMASGMYQAQQKSDTFSALDERSIPEVPEVASAMKKCSAPLH